MVIPPTTEPDDGTGNNAAPIDDARRCADPATLQQARQGDRDAVSSLWRQHAPHLVRLFQTQRLSNADELATQVWTEVGRSIRRFVGDGQAFRRWLLLVASSHARAARPVVTDDDLAAATLSDENRDDTIPGAIGAMATLSPEIAEAMMLRHVHGLSIADIAEITNSEPGDVRLLVHNGTKRLRDVLSVTNDDGKVVERGTEWSVTDRLGERGTPTEFVDEARHVDLMIASMVAGGPATRAARDRTQRKRRAAALVAASAILVGGGFVLTSLSTVNAPASGLTSVDEINGPSGQADVRRLPETPNLRPGADDNGSLPADNAVDAELIELTKAPPVFDFGNGGADPDDDSAASDDSSGDEGPAPIQRAETPTPPAGPRGRNNDLAPGPAAPSPIPATTRPPTTRPPAVGPVNIPIPATTRPPTTRPPATAPPTTTRPPSTTRPPATTPPTTRPPVTAPPTTRPPVTSPPTTRPPPTTPPTTRPPITAPPTTRPPITAPPTTRPPITAPPTTRPPITAPPTTRPPITIPPDDDDDDDDHGDDKVSPSGSAVSTPPT